MILSLLDNWDRAFDEAVKAIKEKKVIAYPTDTLYMVGGNALDKDVLKRAEEMTKARPSCIIIANLEMLLRYFELNEEETKYITRLCPGPYIFMLKPRAKMGIEDSRGNVGVMIPNHIFIRKVCFEADAPISGYPGKEGADVTIESGAKPAGKEPTVVNIREKRVERQGAGEFSFE